MSQDPAPITPPPGTRAIDLAVEIAASPEDVWRCLTDARELERWFPLHARVEPGVGGSIWISWGEGLAAADPITVWDPPRHLRTGGAGAGAGAISLAVDYLIEGRAGGTTRLRLVHSGFGTGDEWDARYAATDAGWSYFLLNLRHYLERHAGTPRRMVWARVRAHGPRPAAMTRLTGREGLGLAGTEEPDASGGLDPALLPGDRFAATGLPVGRIEGSVLHHRPGVTFAGTLEELNDGLVFLEMEPGGDPWHAGIWISTYGVAEDVVERLQRALDERLTRLFPPDAVAEPPPLA
ncbi:MAG TPA: SRPBCC domain-containing protein [Longimicrobiales bacterium]|nr:SRPBCC domain-containing protein [Longimicrobiales bacterium]